jgi:hypothetical protein
MVKKLTLVQPTANVGCMPVGLGTDGAELWKAITGEFLIEDAAGIEVLKQCCFAADMAARCRQQLDERGLIIRAKTGARENPMLRHELNYRQFVTRCLQKLGVLSEPLRDGPGRPPSSLA